MQIFEHKKARRTMLVRLALQWQITVILTETV